MVFEAAGMAQDAPSVQPIDDKLRSPSGEWIVLHTRSRQEKAVARHLQSLEVRYFLPLYEHRTITNGRRLKSLLPLFPGYVFLFGQREDAYAAVETKRVCQVIPVADQEKLQAELQQIAEAIDRGGALMPHVREAIGRRCRVVRGPLMGIEGRVVDHRQVTRLILEVNMLGQAAALDVERSCLELLN